jgi:SAM-dependent methyltransferase
MPSPTWPAGLPTVLHLPKRQRTPLPTALGDDDVRFPEALVELLVEHLTKPGDVVLDPFAGFGTTLVVAEELGRQGWGVELDPARADFVRGRLREPERLVRGDARRLATLDVPPVALCLSSPPYSRPGADSAALTAYREPDPGYAAYLMGLEDVYRQAGALLRPDGRLVIEASNLRGPGGVTPLAWDIARAVGRTLPFCGELVVRWDSTYGYGYDHSYCLVFAPPASGGA